VNFVDLQEQYRRYKTEIMEELAKVLDSAQFIMGPAVGELERALAVHTGAKHAIGCSSGTDALLLGLLACCVKPGDEVIVPDFTFFATAEVVSFLGAVPVFVDIEEDSYNIDAAKIAGRITEKTRGIIPVSLFGQCSDMDAINTIARAHGLWVMEDAAQSYGALYKEKRSGSVSSLAATSFFPAKPLGCYGDGGAVFTGDDGMARRIRELLNHGQSERYRHARVGINGRLDTIQAAVLLVKLRHFEEEMEAKRRIAEGYAERLGRYVKVPVVCRHNTSVWAQYTVRSERREQVLTSLKAKGIPTAVHYPIPLHRQEAFATLRKDDDVFPVSNRVSEEVFSLPIHPFLTDADVDVICSAVVEALA
jgi:UDP-2-acetamido-2-deoxy-ribo-hexuluronate aminotransferase